MNRRARPTNWVRVVFFLLLIAGGARLVWWLNDPANQSRAINLYMPQPEPTATRPVESYVTEAKQLFDEGKLNQAISVYQKAVRANPRDGAIYVALAQVQVFAGDYVGAQASAENAILISATDPHAHAMRAWALDYQGDTLEAEAAIKRSLELEPNDGIAHAIYAEILVDQGAETITKAVDESRLAQSLAPDTLMTHRARGYVLYATANYQEAVKEYQAAIAINGKIPDLHLQLGLNYYALGIYDQAVQEYGAANALNPSDPQPDYLISRTYAGIGEWAKARQYAETAVQDAPTNSRYIGNLGVMDYRNQRFADAVDQLTLAVNGGLSSTGQQVTAIELVPNSPRIAEIYYTYAFALARLGRCGDVLKVQQIISLRIPTDEVSVSNAAQAVAECRAAIPGTPEASATAGEPVTPAATSTP